MQPLINNTPIAISAHHCVTPFGTDPDLLWKACLEGSNCFTNGFGMISDEITESCSQFLKNHKGKFSVKETEFSNPLFDWSLFSILKAFEKAGWTEMTSRDGLIVSTTTSFIMHWEAKLIRHLKGEKIQGNCYQPLGAFPQLLQKTLQHEGPCLMVSSACSASSQAIGIAKQWIQSGYVDRCLIVGAEQLCHLTKSGFKSLSLVGEETCYPFNEDHSGITLGEASAVICLEKWDDKNENQSCITGYGCVSDAFSMTSPRPDGSGPARSMEMAMKEAGIMPQNVDWVYAHGTGSLQNDRAEAAAILQLELDKIPTSSTKAVHGHTLAASGALETILSDYVLAEQRVIPSWKSEPKHYNIGLQQTSEPKAVKHILKNTLGFGGINASLIISRGGLK